MKNYIKPYVLIAPFLILLCSIFLLGLINGIVQSMGYLPDLGMKNLTIKYYKEILRDNDFIVSLLYSIYIATVSSFISILLGIIVSFALMGLGKEHRILLFLNRTPIIVPHLVAIVLILSIFSQTGFASRIFFNLGIINDPNQWPLLVYDRWGFGIILVYLYKQVPFVIMTSFALLRNISRSFGEVAYNLGAGRFQVILRVTLPLLSPTILSVFLIIFAFTFGAFEVPFLVGSPAMETLPVKAYIYYIDTDFAKRPYTMALNVIISLISLCFAWLYVKAFKLVIKYGG